MQQREDAMTTPPHSLAEAAARELDDPNLAERVLAHIGGWAAAMAERLSPPSGPFFSSDGRLLADASLFAPPAEQPCHP